MHCLSVGIDGSLKYDAIKKSKIPLTNAKGAYSSVLGEFVSLGVLYHTKKLERFMDSKRRKKWEVQNVELVSDKHMAIIGYGDIGMYCAKAVKNGFGMKVSGLKRNPLNVSEDAS